MSHSSGYERRAFERGGRNRGVENRLLEMGRGTGEGRGDRRIEGKGKEKRHGCRNNAPPPMSHFLDPIHTHSKRGRGRGRRPIYDWWHERRKSTDKSVLFPVCSLLLNAIPDNSYFGAPISPFPALFTTERGKKKYDLVLSLPSCPKLRQSLIPGWD